MLFEKLFQQGIMLHVLFVEAFRDGIARFAKGERQFGNLRLQGLFLIFRFLLEVVEFTLDFASSGLFFQQFVL